MEGSAAVNPTTSKRITSIKILLAIDVVFFFVELISGCEFVVLLPSDELNAAYTSDC